MQPNYLLNYNFVMKSIKKKIFCITIHIHDVFYKELLNYYVLSILQSNATRFYLRTTPPFIEATRKYFDVSTSIAAFIAIGTS